MANERNRDFGGGQSHGSEQGGADRRDPGADALLELARMIGGQGDPFAPETPRAEPRTEPRMPEARTSEPRLGDVSRAAQESGRDAFAARTLQERFDQIRAAPPPVRDGFDFPGLSGRGGDHPIAPRQTPADLDAGGRAPFRRRREEEFHDEYGGDGNYAEPDDDHDGEEDGPRRRRPARTILAVLGLAVFGGIAAYGYRYVVNAAPPGPTPIIKADNSPTRITPASDVRADGRTADSVREQMVRRDEDPVDVGSAGAPDAASGDPKRVHTVPISASAGPAPSPPDRRPVRVAAAPAAAPVPPPAPRPVAAVQPAPPQRTAAVTPPSETPAPAAAESGGYVVQLAALQSEADAQAEFRRLQTKYSAVLSGRQPLIRRKDQGDRGVFFATQVGPFGARSEAEQLCEQLKSAGAKCFIQRN
jgi:cell division septation protein DedD